MTRAERETARLLGMLLTAGAPVPEGATIHRVYTSPPQRNAGAWAWTLRGPDGAFLDIGSQWPRRVLLAAGVVVSATTLHGETTWHVDPARLPAAGQPS